MIFETDSNCFKTLTDHVSERHEQFLIFHSSSHIAERHGQKKNRVIRVFKVRTGRFGLCLFGFGSLRVWVSSHSCLSGFGQS
ncbi:hypothetical protein V6N13_106172 [Hibiscus sabdariffa]|uniref:Uncharacterized protein n=1 Tax=Hibiscus sabdariffa TaxID=183260 RepID=A0ABR2EZV4_9ROSI